jgi:S1-C subfamily serine protease
LDDSIRDTRGRVGRSERLNWSDLGVAFSSQARGDLTVGSVTSESILGRAGLRRGDEIVSIDGREFSSQAAALNYLNRLDANQTVDIVALRNGEYLNLDASLAGLRTGVAARTPARAYLGVTFDDQARDLRVFGIDRNSPAFRAGLRRGDQIVSINGREFGSYRDAVEFIQTRSPNEQLDMTILRNGREIELQANLAGTGQGTGRLTARGSSFAQGGRAGLGVVFDQRSSDRILISEVADGSPAEIAGLRQGDVILSVDGRRMSSFDEVSDYIGRRSPEEQVDIAVLRNGRRINLQAELASRQEVFDQDQGASRSFQRDTQRTRLGDRFVEEGFEQSERFPDVERDSGLPARVRESREAMRRRANEATGSVDGQGGARESIRERERNRGQDSTYSEGEIGDRAGDPRRGSDDN